MVCGKYNVGDAITFVLGGKELAEIVLRNGIIISCYRDSEGRQYIVKTPTGDEFSVSEQSIAGCYVHATADTVNHPAHYTQGGIECNAIKYLWRWKRKNRVEDLKKAAWYIQRLIEEQGG